MLSDKQIIEGFRRGDSYIYRQYFYNYCLVAYYLFDSKYQLSKKENLDFMSLAHQYAIYLMEHNWKPLTDRSPNVSLRTWMINGFRFIVLDALKWYKKEYGTLTYEEYLKSFDTNQNLRVQFDKVVVEICDSMKLDRISRTILIMLLVEGYKTKEVAEKLGITSAAVSQRFGQLKSLYVFPYFKHNFDMDFDMQEVMDSQSTFSEIQQPKETCISESVLYDRFDISEFIRELAPGEIFVFGSNLRGMHGGGAAYAAYRYFGAIMGQGVGLQGRSYAIPTMQGGVETIKPYVDEFIEFAKQHAELTFLVTRIGCGIAGFSDYEIAPLFKEAHNVDNIVLPRGW